MDDSVELTNVFSGAAICGATRSVIMAPTIGSHRRGSSTEELPNQPLYRSILVPVLVRSPVGFYEFIRYPACTY